MLHGIKSEKYLSWFFGFLIFVYFFIAYIKGTIGLNYIIMSFFIIILFYLYKKVGCKLCNNLKELEKPMLLMGIFIVWILFQAIFISQNTAEHLSEIRGQFLVPIIFLIIGISVFLLIKKEYLDSKIVFNIIFFTGFLHISIIVISALFNLFMTGYLPIRVVYILPVDEVSFFTNLIYSMFLSEIYMRIIKNKRTLYIPNKYLFYLIFLTFLFSIYLQGMRWGVITFSSTTLFFSFFLIYNMNLSRKKKISFFIATCISIVLLIGLNIKSDKRWDTIVETIEIILKDDSLYWVNMDKFKDQAPRLSNGQIVNDSNYLRLSQQINGYKMVLDYPLGVGYSRYAYTEAVNLKYNNNAGTFDFPHSGVLNLILGVGIVGIVLYITFFYLVFKLLLLFEWSYYKVFTIFLIIAFHMRSFVDMTFMNHNLKVFMLLLGLGIMASILYGKKESYEKS